MSLLPSDCKDPFLGLLRVSFCGFEVFRVVESCGHTPLPIFLTPSFSHTFALEIRIWKKSRCRVLFKRKSEFGAFLALFVTLQCGDAG